MRIEECERLVNALAARVYRRLRAACGRVFSMEDIRQELWIAICIARDNFDESLGVKFSTYAWRGMILHVNRWILNEFERNKEYNYALTLDGTAGEDSELALKDAVADENAVDPAQSAERESCYAEAMRNLSPRAQICLRILNDTPLEMVEEMRKLSFKADYARKRKVAFAMPKRLSFSMVFDVMGASRPERTKIMRELETVAARISR